MLSMAKMCNGNSLFCKDLSWTFSNFVSKENDGKMVDAANDRIGIQKEKDNDGKMLLVTNNQIEIQMKKGKEKEKKEVVVVELSSPLPPPPPPPEVKGKRRVAGELEHDQHIITERERRKKMRNMFNDLHSLIPHLPPRADKSTIVDEAVEYIKSLQQTLGKLEKQKLNAKATGSDPPGITATPIQSREAFLADQGAVTLAYPNYYNNVYNYNEFAVAAAAIVFKTWTSPNVVLNVAGKDAHVSICCPNNKAKAGVLRKVCSVMAKYQLLLLSVQVSTNACGRMYFLHARAIGAADQFPEESLYVEEVYKQATTEIMMWLN